MKMKDFKKFLDKFDEDNTKVLWANNGIFVKDSRWKYDEKDDDGRMKHYGFHLDMHTNKIKSCFMHVKK